MGQRQRSPFGELVHRYRTACNLTQAQLSTYVACPLASEGGGGVVSERTIASIERRYGPDDPWSPNHAATVEILAWKFGLLPESPEWVSFHDAANATRLMAPILQISEPMASDIDAGFISAGREQPLARLLAAVQLLKHGVPGAMMVGAEAGAGKSRLLAHACQIASDTIPDLVVLWGSSTEPGHPYQPLVQMMNQMMGQSDHANRDQVISPNNVRNLEARLPLALEAIATDGRGLIDRILSTTTLAALQAQPKLAHYLTALLSTDRTPSTPHDFVDEVWQLLVRYSEYGPVMVVWENLHHADEGTADLMLHLLRRLSESSVPIMMLGSYRPFDVDPANGQVRAPIAAVLRDMPHSVYDPLIDLHSAAGGEAGRSYVTALVESRIQNVPPHLVDDIYSLTEGLPLLVDVALDWYETEGALFPSSDGDALRWRQTPFPLPSTIQTVFEDLLANLGPTLLDLLEQASMQGMIFSADILQRVAGLTRQTLIVQLDDLLTRRAHVVEPAGSRTIAGRRTYDYRFHHAMLGEFVYERLSPARRTALHMRTAETMISLWGSTTHNGAVHIARQFELAEDLSGAATWYLKAGDYHLFRHEHREAVAHYQRIQKMDLRAIAPFEAVQSLVGLGNCSRGLGDLDAARQHLLTARIRAQQSDLLLVEANSLTSLGMVEFDAGRLDVGTAHLARAVELLLELDNTTEACRSLALLSHLLHGCGRYDDASTRANQAIALAESIDQEPLVVYGLVALTDSLLALGNYELVIEMMERGLEIANEHHDIPRIVLCSLNHSHALIELGDLDRARQAVDRVFSLQHATNGRMIGGAHFDMGLILERQGHLDEAREHFELSRRLREQHHQWALLMDSMAALLRLAILRGDRPEVKSLSALLQERLKQQGADGVEQVARLYLTLAEAGRFQTDCHLESRALSEGRDFLLHRAALLSIEQDRDAFLHSVPANLELLNRADVLAGGH